MWKAWNIVTHPRNSPPPPVLLGGSNKWHVGSEHGFHGFSQAWLGSISANLVPFHCLDNAAFSVTWSLTVFYLILSLTPSSHPTILWCLFQNCVPCSHCPDSGSIFLCQKIVTRRAASLPLWSPLLLCLWSYFPGSSDIFFFLWLSSLHVCLLSRQLYPF